MTSIYPIYMRTLVRLRSCSPSFRFGAVVKQEGDALLMVEFKPYMAVDKFPNNQPSTCTDASLSSIRPMSAGGSKRFSDFLNVCICY